MSMHLSFLRRTEVGFAVFKVLDVKLGARTSIVHITLSQQDREEVVAYVTNTNLINETGPSFPTSFSLDPPPPKVELSMLESGQDSQWGEPPKLPFIKFRKAVQNVHFFFPRVGQTSASTLDQWITLASGEAFTDTSLGFVVDMFPQIIENHRFHGKDPYAVDLANRPSEEDMKKSATGPFWYPTVLLNLEVKKALPDKGSKWLFVRIGVKMIRNGRYDIEVLVFDETGDLVAISNHVALIMEAARNLSKRTDKGKL